MPRRGGRGADGGRKNVSRKGRKGRKGSGRGCGRAELTRRRRAAEGLKDGFAQKDKKETKGRLECRRMANIETHENRFTDMEKREESGCAVGARASRPRGAWEAKNTRKGQCFL